MTNQSVTPRQPHAFLSYRDDDAPNDSGLTEELATMLKTDLGAAAVYFAPTDNKLGEDFADRIDRELAESDSVVALIGPRWEADAHGRNRFEVNPEDYVRLELATALEDPSTDLLPLLVERDRSPAKADLPEDIRRVATTNGVPRFSVAEHYQSVLTQVWASFARNIHDVVLVVADATEAGVATVKEFVEKARNQGELDLDGMRKLSQLLTQPPGLVALPLAEPPENVPQVLLVENEGSVDSDTMRQRHAGAEAYARRHGLRVQTVSAAAAAALLGFSIGNPSWASAVGGWWEGLSVAGKGVAAGSGVVAAGLVTAGVVVLSADPPALAGTWNVVESSVDGGSVNVASGALDAETFVFEPVEAGCSGAGCPLVNTEGPDTVRGQQFEADGDTYKSSTLNYGPTCRGESYPADSYTAEMIVEHGESDDTLRFKIVVDIEEFAGCEADTVTAEALAERQTS
jgi:hypothetical protein